jgi:hypothetical protein
MPGQWKCCETLNNKKIKMKTILVNFRKYILLFAVLIFVGCEKKVKDPEPEPVNPLPVVETAAVSDITETTALSGGNVTSEGTSALSAVGICWDINPAPTILRPHTNVGKGTGSFISSATNLNPNTTYYLRAYATNGAGTAYGNERIFKTSSTWNVVDSFPGAINSLLIDGSKLYLATSVTGIQSGDLNGSGFSEFNNGLPDYNALSITLAGSKLFSSISGYGIYRSVSSTINWVESNGGIVQSAAMNIFSIAANSQTLIAGTIEGVYRSVNDGVSWVRINSLPVDFYYAACFNGNECYVAGEPGVYHSYDNGLTWNKLNISATINCFLVNGNEVYMGGYKEIYKTADGGATNIKLVNGLPAAFIKSLAMKGTNIYAGTYEGVFISKDFGFNWNPINTGLGNYRYISSIAIYSDVLYAGTQNGRLYKKTIE